jgi:hypothetical protein
MNLPEPVQPKKANKNLWIIIIIIVVAVILLFCVLAAALGGGYIYLKQKNTLPSFTPGGVPSPTAAQVPTATSEPLVPLTIEPANPTTSSYPALPDLVSNWTASMKPGPQTWSASVSRNQPVLLFVGWCATTPDILAFNLKHITYKLVVDDQPVDVTSLYKWDSQESDRVCQTYVGLIRTWTGTSHTIVTTMTMDWALNDGFDDYLAGDFTDVYNVTVTP